jgi:DNA-binding response OmpR family regulator
MADILVVADAPWVMNDIRAALTDPRLVIHEVGDPRAVVGIAKDLEPDVVVVDLQIGSMGGMAVTRAIRDAFATAHEPAPPVILLLDRDADAFLAGRSGAAGWVRKPFSADDLRSAITPIVTVS